MSTSELDKRVVIIGAGCFGVSTALHLLQRGYKDVTVVDKSEHLPAPDAASTDLNKVIRSTYRDPFYCKLGHEAIQLWKDKEIWGDTYHETGFYLGGQGSHFGNEALDNDIQYGARVQRLATIDQIKSKFPPDIPLGTSLTSPSSLPVSFNLDGGWAAAGDAVGRGLDKIEQIGAKILAGKCADGILRTGGQDDVKVKGVKFTDGSVIDADLVVVATGSWTASAFREEGFDKHVFASGQGIVTIQLSPEDAERYAGCPVILLDDKSGFYMFPPDKNNIIKMAAHGAGYLHKPPSSSSISVPRTVLSDGEDGLRIPKDMVHGMRNILKDVYPELAKMPFASTRMCWYTYTNDSDWIIDNVQGTQGFFIVTGGSGHGFKFLPIIGRLVVDRIEGKMPVSLVDKFALTRDRGPWKNWGWTEEPQEFDLGNLNNEEDLLTVN